MLRRFTLDDADDLLALDSDPLVRRFVEDGEPVTRDNAVEMIEHWLGYHEWSDLFGFWAAIDRATGRPRLVSLPAGRRSRRRRARARVPPDLVGVGQWASDGGVDRADQQGFLDGAHTPSAGRDDGRQRGSRRVMEKAGMRLVRTFMPNGRCASPATRRATSSMPSAPTSGRLPEVDRSRRRRRSECVAVGGVGGTGRHGRVAIELASMDA